MKQFVFYTKWIGKWPIIISSLLLLAVCLTWTGPLTVAHANIAPAWDGNRVQYTVGEKVTYNGNLYQCLQSHTSLPNWNPVDAASLWQRISGSSVHHTRRRSNTTPTSPVINRSFIDFSTYYYIRSKSNNFVLDIRRDSTDPNTPVIAFPRKNRQTDNQLWRFVPDNEGDGYAFIQSKSGMYLDIRNTNGDQNPDSGSLVIAYTKDSGEAANQLWRFSNGYIQSRAPNALVLDIQDSNPNGTTVTAHTQNGSANPCWTLVPA